MSENSERISRHAVPLQTENQSLADATIDASEPRRSMLARVRAVVGSLPFVYGLLFGILVLFWIIGLERNVSVSRLLSLTVWGVSLGGVLALGSIGLTLTYGVLKFPNFAHGAIITIGAYITYEIVRYVPLDAPLRPFSFGWDLLIGLAIAMPLTGIIAAGCDRIVFLRLRNRGASLVLFAMASLGLAFVLRSIIYMIWTSEFRFYYLGRANPALHLPFGVNVQADKFFNLGLALVMVFFVHLLLTRTKMGKAMRATADNPDLAKVRGIDTERVITWTWFIGGGLAAAGGVMFGLASQLRPEMGFLSLLLPIFAAVVLGGIGSAYGALVGSLIIGMAWQLTAAVMAPTYGPGVAFAIMVLMLVIRPQGLFGSSQK